MEEPWGGRAYVLADDAFLYVTVTVIDPETLNRLDTRDAAVALAENLAVRIGA
jgi:hypothetical protein